MKLVQTSSLARQAPEVSISGKSRLSHWLMVYLNFCLGSILLGELDRELQFELEHTIVAKLWLDNCVWGKGLEEWPIPSSYEWFTSQSFPLPTLWADFTGADKVALVAHQDDWRVWLGLPEEEAELGGAVETSPVSHREHQDTHVTLQSGQVLGMQAHKYTHTHTHELIRTTAQQNWSDLGG